jgi:hypothetical protein
MTARVIFMTRTVPLCPFCLTPIQERCLFTGGLAECSICSQGFRWTSEGDGEERCFFTWMTAPCEVEKNGKDEGFLAQKVYPVEQGDLQ